MSLLKIPMLLVLFMAHHIAYSSPNSFVPRSASDKGSTVTGCVRVLRPPWVRKVSKIAMRAVILCEILTILAACFPSPASTYALSILDRGITTGGAAQHIRITPGFFIGSAVAMSGGLLRLACYRTLGQYFTYEITIRKDHRLVTSGPYSIVRHPSYLASLLVVVGNISCFLGSGSWLRESGILREPLGKAFVVLWVADMLWVPTVMILFRVRVEDGLLKKEFGREWEEWAERTPYALLPGVF
ncbi:ICMT-domain-containing protein [Cubamyces sp. BRFM 1775]|nr:ICMT-domain-containing protein [Cubamyces sp. BRFM 1775]